MAKKQAATSSKRQVLREQRARRERRQRLILILGMTGVAVIIAALLIIPSIQRANAPVGQIIQPTPRDHPQADGTSMGDPNAPVKMMVFEDFQCPACRQYTETVEPLIVQNDIVTGKVYYTFKQFPFIDNQVLTKESHQAANASMCAAAQGKFWNYHDMLFANWNGENQGSFTDKRLAAFAQNLGLDMSAFNTCFSQNTYQKQINDSVAEGKSLGVTGTPSVFVDGKIVSPGYIPTYDDIQKAIDAAAKAAGG